MSTTRTSGMITVQITVILVYSEGLSHISVRKPFQTVGLAPNHGASQAPYWLSSERCGTFLLYYTLNSYSQSDISATPSNVTRELQYL